MVKNLIVKIWKNITVELGYNEIDGTEQNSSL